MILDQMQSMVEKGVTQQEFVRAKDQLKGNYILGLESTVSRMNAIGKSITLINETNTSEETIEHIEQTTFDDVKSILPYVFDFEKVSVSAVGKIDKKAIKAVFDEIC